MASQIHTSQTDGRDFLAFVLQLIKSTTCTVSSRTKQPTRQPRRRLRTQHQHQQQQHQQWRRIYERRLRWYFFLSIHDWLAESSSSSIKSRIEITFRIRYYFPISFAQTFWRRRRHTVIFHLRVLRDRDTLRHYSGWPGCCCHCASLN